MKHAKRIFSILLAVLLPLGLLAPAVSALDLSQSYEVSWDHILTDENNNPFRWYTGLNASDNPYGYALPAQERSMHDYTVKCLGLAGDNSDWTYDQDFLYAFCIEHGRPINDKTSYKGSSNPNHGDKWAAMSANQRNLIQLALAHGYPNEGNIVTSKDANACYAATQLIVWQISFGFRTSPTALNDKTYAMSGHSGTMTQQLLQNAHLKRYYDAILTAMANHYLIPSFTGASAATAPTYTMAYSGGQYRLTLTDTTGVLPNFTGVSDGGLSAGFSGNSLVLSSPTPITGATTVVMTKRLGNVQTTGFLIWSAPGKEGDNQDMVTGVDVAPVPCYVKLMTDSQPTGHLRITKTVVGGNGGSFQFEVRDSAGTLIGTYTIQNSGVVTIPDLPTGSYSVREINIPAGYILQSGNPKTVSVFDGETTGVEFVNVCQQGQIVVRKINSNPSMDSSSLAGAQFEIWSPSGGTLYETITTNASGTATSGMLSLGDYVVREKTPPSGFIRNPNSFPVTLSAGGGTAEVIVGEVTVPQQPQPGRINVNKSNSDPSLGSYSLAGAVFGIYDVDGNLLQTVTTGNDGKAQSGDLPLSSYRVRELSAPYGFVKNSSSFTATLSYAGADAQYAYTTVDIPERPQTGIIRVHKTNSNVSMGDYALSNATFEVRNSSGALVDTITSNAAGLAQTKELPLGAYQIKEVNSPWGFVLNTNEYNATLSYATDEISTVYADVTIPNQPQTGTITVTKLDKGASTPTEPFSPPTTEPTTVNTTTKPSTITTTTKSTTVAEPTIKPTTTIRTTETSEATVIEDPNVTIPNTTVATTMTTTTTTTAAAPATDPAPSIAGDTAQGDATLNGAVFEIYASDKTTLLDTLYCGSNSAATSRELPLGTYYYKERNQPVGYLPDAPGAFYEVKIEYAGQNVTIVEKSGDVKNQVILGQIALTKHTDQPDPNVDPPNPQVEQPLEGAIFEVYLKSAGSYNAAKATEKDRITTNVNGYAITIKMPYGVYVVHEISAPGDVKLVPPFDVFINADGQIYRFILNDPAFTSLVKIVKTDAETGKTIPLAGTSFKVRDAISGKWIVQHINYPTPMDLDVFETAADGTLVMPAALKSGSYELHEQRAPYGYLLGTTPVPFTIHSSQATPEMIEVNVPNKPVKGVIKLEKTGDMLVGVKEIRTEFGTQYQPIYAPGGVSGAEFQVIAAEDVRTPDGTVRYTKGTVVDTLTTVNGKAESKLLYLGHYELRETKTVEPFILNPGPHYVSLVYENQEVAVVSSPITIHNTRQEISIELRKLMERPVDAPDGFNPFADVTFGLFADQDFKAVNGSVVIPKGNLVSLITVDSNGKGMLQGNLPFGKYFVQELKTNAYYQLADTKYPVEGKYAGSDKAVAHVQVHNGGIALPNELKLGKLTVLKQGEQLVGFTQDEADGYIVSQPLYELRGLPGAKFDVVAGQDIYNVYGKRIHQKGDLMDTITTGEDGKATTKLLPLARYELVELESPAGYVLLSEAQKVVLGIEGSVLTEIISKEIAVVNQRTKAKLNLSKAAEKPEGVPKGFNPYKDILFGIFVTEDLLDAGGVLAIPKDTLLEVLRFDAEGRTEMKTDLPYGKFYAKELATAVGYELLDTKFPFEFASGGGAAVVTIDVNGGKPVHNKLLRGGLEIIKTFEGKSVPIEGVPFIITGKTVVGTDYRGEFVTDKDGKILVEDLLVGEYTVEELGSELTAGYLLSEAEAITVAAGEIASMTINNRCQRGGLKVIKTFEGREAPFAGVPFLITGKTVIGQDFSAQVVTDENGEIMLDALLIGEYTVQELQTDLTLGYVLSESQTIAVAQDKIAETKIHNKLQRGSLKIIKTFENKDTPIAGVPFTVEGTSLAGIPYSEIFKTDENGVILIEGLPVGQYTVREMDDNLTEGYVLSKTQTAIVAADKLTELIIDNKLQRGNLKIIKTFEGLEQPIANVPFVVEGTSKTGVKFSETFYTNAEGIILVEGLPVGDYTVRELGNDLTKGYVLAEEQTVTVKADATAEIAIENKLQRGSLKILKTFEGQKKPVTGVKFTVEGVTAAGGKFSGEYETDKDGVILVEGLPVGEYVVKEVASELNLGYVLADAQVVVIKEGETTELAIENKLAKGKIEILKIDAEDKKPLADAMFGLYQKGKLIAEAKSDKNGIAVFSDLLFDDYEVRELSAPVGYKRDDTSHKVTIGEGKTQISLTFTNEKLPGEPVEPSEPEKPAGWTPPKMGDDTSIVKWLVIIGCVAFVGAGYFLLRRRKRGEADEPIEKEEE